MTQGRASSLLRALAARTQVGADLLPRAARVGLTAEVLSAFVSTLRLTASVTVPLTVPLTVSLTVPLTVPLTVSLTVPLTVPHRCTVHVPQHRSLCRPLTAVGSCPIRA